MTTEEQILKNEIMMRVRFIYGLKALPRIFVPKIALLASLVAVAGFFVSVPHVVRNMPSLLDIQNFTHFFAAAFWNTNLIIQAISLGTLLLVGLMIRDFTKIFHIGDFRTADI